MTEEEKKYAADAAKAGADVPGLKEEDAEKKAADEAKAKEVADAAAKAKADEEAKKAADDAEAKKKETEHLQDPDGKETERKPRSIYEEYKDKKSELKVEREAREKAEKELSEARTKIEALEKAKTPEERKDAQDDLDEFAKEINADPAAIRKMRDIFLKGVKAPETDESLKKDMAEFKAWKQANQKNIEKSMFDEEFTKTTPALKNFFPKITDEELIAVKKELDVISHTKEYHDKELEYVAYKNLEKLTKLVSPKKRGMEGKERKDVDESSTEFDANADLSKMTPKERSEWEKTYRKATKVEGLITDAQGRKVLL